VTQPHQTPAQTPVFDRFARAWPKPDAPRAEYLPIEAAFGTTWPWDAHFAAYSRPDVPHRLDSDSPGVDATEMVLAAFDVDAPGKAATAAWYAAELPKVQAVAAAHPGVWVYPTRGGYRLVWRLAAPQPTRGWWRYVRAWLGYLESTFAITADPKCTDWTRLYRLPLVRRDGTQTDGHAVQYGTGTWAPPVQVQPEPVRATHTTAPVAPRPAAYAAVVALHFANPPSDDRNAHSMAFAAAGAYLGASQERVEADLTALLERSGADQRHVRAVSRIVERTFERVAEGETVTWRPSAWRGTQLELDLGAAWQTREPDAPAPHAPPVQPTVVPGVARASLTDLDLIGAPANVERALMRYRGRQDPGSTPELKDSRAVIRWLVEVKQWTPDQVGSELGPGAQQAAADLAREEVQSPGRLAQLDELLKPVDLRFNQLTLAIEVHGGSAGAGARRDWSDSDTALYRALAELRGISAPDKPVARGDIEERARARAEASAYHPVRDYLTGLRWDGQPRLDQLWVRYFGAAAGPVHQALGACFALGAVRRAMQPGTKVDLMPILYGDQGVFKSTAIKVLAGRDFYTDASPQFGHRSENTLTLTGCWIWEIPELEGFDRSEQNAIKAFVTRTEDHVLLPYARIKTRHPRHSVMLGTTNVEQCLKDPTGSRRHPVVAVGSIDVQGLEADRDQLWAEACVRAATAEPHWMGRELGQLMAEQNDQFQSNDETYEAALLTWFGKEPRVRLCKDGVALDRFTIPEALLYAIGIPTERQDHRVQTRAGQALNRLGMKPIRETVYGVRHRYYMFPPSMR
jgi:predicted P-loop ATPase